ncbi:MAG: GGDEF domain-containing protein [Deltaproteobacteria bacterium]|nr:GGDEF domain-containing protein [Deltaproteobacteria bacterium]
MERFYLTVARVAKKTLHYMVEHRIPMLPDIYSRHFYKFLSASDQDSQTLIQKHSQNDQAEIRSQQEQSLELIGELQEMIGRLDQITGEHIENLDNHLLSIKVTDQHTDLNRLKDEISRELSQVIDSNNEIHHNIVDAQQTVKRLQKKMQEVADMATIDELTGLFNRRALFSRLLEEQSRALRYEQGFSLLLIDIDDFKNINDQHGHQVGDGILKGLGSFFRQNLRDCDFPARFGGEEFICLLPSTSLEQAVLVADKLRKLLSHSTLSSRDGGVNLKITVSIGAATFDGESDIDSLIKRADDALYLAKRRGKNQVVTELEL